MLKVLVVDDDEGLRTSVKAALAQTGHYTVDEAADGLQAVTKVRQGGYSLAIVDVDMPNLNGLDALKLMKDFDAGIIVIVMTAYSNIEDAVRAETR
jgi:DNA-binding NtrC family response regulator